MGFLSDVGASGSSYWSLDGPSDGVVPVGSCGVRVSLDEELAPGAGGDLPQIRHGHADVSMEAVQGDLPRLVRENRTHTMNPSITHLQLGLFRSPARDMAGRQRTQEDGAQLSWMMAAALEKAGVKGHTGAEG